MLLSRNSAQIRANCVARRCRSGAATHCRVAMASDRLRIGSSSAAIALPFVPAATSGLFGISEARYCAAEGKAATDRWPVATLSRLSHRRALCLVGPGI